MFLNLIRKILSALLLTLDRLFPAAIDSEVAKRSPEQQARLNAETQNFQLYQFNGCPFCIKVRREIRRLGLMIVLRDAGVEGDARKDLITEGGELQVPCLRITLPEGKINWIYESTVIVEHLRQLVART